MGYQKSMRDEINQGRRPESQGWNSPAPKEGGLELQRLREVEK